MSDKKDKKFVIRVSESDREEWSTLSNELGLQNETALIRFAIKQLSNKTNRKEG